MAHAPAFHIAADLPLPLDVVTQRLGFLGISGSGKTFAANRLAELMLEAGAQVIAVDPVGVWRGLRTSADGKGNGFAILILGGIYGDLPLVPEAGAVVADLLVDRAISAVLDVSDFTAGQQHRFVSDFAERFFERKKRSPGPVHIFLEESQTFLPQNLPPDPNAAKMLHRVARLVKVGRNYGIGTSQISQRPQAVSKDALSQIACLFAFRMLGKAERKAVEAWLGDNQTTEGEAEDVDQLLRRLDTGQAWASSPHWLGLAKVVRISRRTTFDSSATPKFGVKAAEAKALAPVDVEQLRVSMAAVVEQAERDDPAALRRRLAKAEAELARARAAAPAAPAARVERVEVPAVDAETLAVLGRNLERAEKHLALLDAERDQLAQAHQVVSSALDNLALQLKTLRATPAKVAQPPAPVRPAAAPRRAPGGAAVGATPGGVVIKSGARGMAQVLATFVPDRLTRQQLATLSGFAIGGGTFGDYLSALRRAGYLDESDSGLTLTAAGLDFIDGDAPAHPSTTEELVAMWAGSLKEGAVRMLRVLVEDHPAWLGRMQLADKAGNALSGGTFGDYLSALHRNGLIEKKGDQVRASDTLFLGARRG